MHVVTPSESSSGAGVGGGGHGLPPDPAMPGFAEALDPRAMAPLIEAHVLPPGAVCSDLRIVRFRHRPGERLVVVYDATIATGRSGAADRLVLAGRIHPQRPTRDRRVLARGGLCEPERAGGIAGRAFVPQLGMTVDVFPEDRRLPALRRFFDEPAAALAGFGLPLAKDKRADPLPVPVELMRYRPGLSATLRMQIPVAPGSDAREDVYVKVSNDGDIASEADGAYEVNAELSRIGAPLRLMVPRAVDLDACAALYRKARGTTVQDLMAASAASNDIGRRAGAALARLHTLAECRLPGTFAADIGEKIARSERNIAWACPDLAAQAMAAATAARAVAATGLALPTHRDMKPDHLFLCDDGSAEMIDAGSVSAGNPLVDVGSMLARLDLMVATGLSVRAQAEAVKAALLAAYFDDVPAGWRAHLPAARAYGALLVSTHAIQGLLPGWRSIVAAEMETATAAAFVGARP